MTTAQTSTAQAGPVPKGTAQAGAGPTGRAASPGGPLPEPSQLPEVFNKLQDFRLDVRHRLTNKLAATFAYRYEPFSVYDFAFDPSVVNGIVQPSSLVLGYVYARTRRVMPLVICHALLDIVAFVGYSILKARGITL